MTTISNGAVSATPRLVVGLSTIRRGRNVVKDLVGTEEVAVDLRTAGKRSGTIVYLFESQADGVAAEQLHAAAAKITLTEPLWPSGGMAYVVDGDIALELDEDTQTVYLLAVDFREVAP